METIYVTISEISPNLEVLEVLEAREKSYRVRNKETGHECFIPKSGLKLRKPGVPTYENEYILAGWFRSKLSYAQERALQVAG